MKIITATGYGGTGSSAVTNILQEFNNIENLGEFEFRFLQDPDGIKDLEYGLVLNPSRLNSDITIKRFKKMIKFLSKKNTWWNGYDDIFDNKFNKISLKYIESLIDIRWNGFWHYHEITSDYQVKKIIKLKLLLNKILYKILKKKYLVKSEMFFSISDEKLFYDKTKDYLDKLFSILNKKNKEFLLLDQLVPAINAQEYVKFFTNIKIIIVDRDPRDLFYLNKYVWQESWIPNEVNLFIEWYKKLRSRDKINNENILHIQFEDLIYSYEDSLVKILNFLKISNKSHLNQKKYFNPEISKKNTEVFDRGDKDIKEIERKLKEYCFQFPITKKIELGNTEIF